MTTLLRRDAALEFAVDAVKHQWPPLKRLYLGDRSDLVNAVVASVLGWTAELENPDKVPEDELTSKVAAFIAAEVRSLRRGSGLVSDSLSDRKPQFGVEESAKTGAALRGAIDTALRSVGYDDRDLEVVWLSHGLDWTAEEVAEEVNSQKPFRRLPRLTPAEVEAKAKTAAETLRLTGPPELTRAWRRLRQSRERRDERE